jgi:hypothetical protein
MPEETTKKPKLNPSTIDKLAAVLTKFWVPAEIIDKIKEILWSSDMQKSETDMNDHPDAENPDEDKTDIMSESSEEEDAMKQMDNPKRKLSLNGVKVICISE